MLPLIAVPAYKESSMADQQERTAEQKPGYLLNLEPVYLHNCPYLGLLHDRRTSLAFPAQGNCCHRLQLPATVDLSHQRSYCLTEDHVRCYVFQQEELPAGDEQIEREPLLSMIQTRGLGPLAAVLGARFTLPEIPFSAGFRLPFDFFSGNLTLPPDPWGRESFEIPENPFKAEFAAAAIFLRSSATAGSAFIRRRAVLPRVRLDEWLHPPAELGERPRSYLAFPLMLALMFVAALVWWPSPGQTADQLTARGETLAQAGEVSPDAPAATFIDSWSFGPALPSASLNSASSGEAAEEMISARTAAAAGQPETDDTGTGLFTIEIRPTDAAPAAATAEPFVLGPQEPVLVAAAPPALPTIPAPATPTARPTGDATWLFPLPTSAASAAVVTAPTETPTEAPTEVPTETPTEPAPLPIVDVAYIHSGALNLRSGPGLDYPAVDIAYNRDEVYLLGSQGYDPWMLIRLPSGSEGWVNAKYLRAEPQP
jgi:uncharacterized protein YgiM (DUF1202 family)